MLKYEIRSSKSETSSEIQKYNDKNFVCRTMFSCKYDGFFHWDFVFLNLFRISYFEFRIFYFLLVWFWLRQLMAHGSWLMV